MTCQLGQPAAAQSAAAQALASLCMQLEVCKEQVQWAQSEKRTFLRQRIEIRLATLYLETKEYTAAISLIGKLLTEVSACFGYRTLSSLPAYQSDVSLYCVLHLRLWLTRECLVV